MKFFIVKLVLIGIVAAAVFATGVAIQKSLRAAMEERRHQIERIVPDIEPNSVVVA